MKEKVFFLILTFYEIIYIEFILIEIYIYIYNTRVIPVKITGEC